ncbi:MAG: hypothetical protein M1837_002528 [Sclerophora amabilis]|nr:MAG: hypothetical protein M1837_002528 [Sclerophora amabilis]
MLLNPGSLLPAILLLLAVASEAHALPSGTTALALSAHQTGAVRIRQVEPDGSLESPSRTRGRALTRKSSIEQTTSTLSFTRRRTSGDDSASVESKSWKRGRDGREDWPKRGKKPEWLRTVPTKDEPIKNEIEVQPFPKNPSVDRAPPGLDDTETPDPDADSGPPKMSDEQRIREDWAARQLEAAKARVWHVESPPFNPFDSDKFSEQSVSQVSPSAISSGPSREDLAKRVIRWFNRFTTPRDFQLEKFEEIIGGRNGDSVVVYYMSETEEVDDFYLPETWYVWQGVDRDLSLTLPWAFYRAIRGGVVQRCMAIVVAGVRWRAGFYTHSRASEQLSA